MTLLMAVITAFTITVGQYGNHILIRYPWTDDESVTVVWREVCVWTLVRSYDGRDPSIYYDWESTSCWTPRHKVEEYRLSTGALRVRGTLKLTINGVDSTVTTGVIPVRPEPEEDPDQER